MAAIKLRIAVRELSNVLTQFTEIKVYRSTTGSTGPWTEITGPGTRVVLVVDETLYEYIDSSGNPAYWYRFAYYNPTVPRESTASAAVQGEGSTGMYCTLQDIRDEGVTVAYASDARVTVQIQLASKMLEAMTGRWFEPRDMALPPLDGRGTRVLRFGFPIVAVESIEIDGDEIDLDDVLVYNRHISGLVFPDDRDDPRIEYPAEDGVVWPVGSQNIVVVGTFGYTDYDGTGGGKTPELIEHACKLLTIRELAKIASPARGDLRDRWRVSTDRTRDQAQTLSAPSALSVVAASSSGLTGDPEIDGIILRYRKPPGFGRA